MKARKTVLISFFQSLLAVFLTFALFGPFNANEASAIKKEGNKCESKINDQKVSGVCKDPCDTNKNYQTFSAECLSGNEQGLFCCIPTTLNKTCAGKFHYLDAEGICKESCGDNESPLLSAKGCTGPEQCCALPPASATQKGKEETSAAPVSILANPYHFLDPLDGTNVSEIVNRLINSVLLLVGGLFFVMFLWGGVTWMISEGDKTKVEKATKTLKNAVIGIAIVATSYILVTNIIKILSS